MFISFLYCCCCCCCVVVECPVCGAAVKRSLINSHLDRCLADPFPSNPLNSDPLTSTPPSSKGVGIGVQYKHGRSLPRLPKIVFSIMTDRELKKKLKEYGLPTQGQRKTLMARLQEFTLQYKAQQDSLHPKTGKGTSCLVLLKSVIETCSAVME